MNTEYNIELNHCQLTFSCYYQILQGFLALFDQYKV